MRSSTVYRRPVYGIGHHDWVRYLRENTYSEGPEDGPIALDEEVNWTSERVLVCFMVDKTGLVSWAKIMNKVKIPRDISKEVMRVLRHSPRWRPGYAAGNAVPYFLIQPFNVILPD